MLLGKKRKIGRGIEAIDIGEKLTLTEKMEDKELLLYLGLTGDSNPLYIQHDYASLTSFRKPIVPSIMLAGIVTSAVSKYLPGPGSYIAGQNFSYLKPVHHYETISFQFEVKSINEQEGYITINVEGYNEEKEKTFTGTVDVVPPKLKEDLDGATLDNF
ncbi:MAG: MaoC/PaaZ C-terminal domain-containing protein [Bacillus sp. (in: firmicutes)]